MATLKDVAAKAGVSIPVVSAFISGSKYVRMSEATRERVAAAIEEVGYVPNLAARSLRTLRTNVIAVVVPKLDNPALADLLQGVYDRAAEAGYVIMLGDAAQLTSGSRIMEHFSAQGTVDGFLVRRSSALPTGVVDNLLKRGLPLVFLDKEPAAGLHWLAPDDAGGVRAATEYLISLGHERIAFLGGPDLHFTRLRHEGYVAAMTARGLPAGPPIHSGQDSRSGFEAFNAHLAERISADEDVAPTALVVNNSMTAVGVLAAAHDAGIRVPEQLSVIGYHDIAAAQFARPALSTIKMPMYDIGRVGVDMLHDVINGVAVESRVLDDPAPVVCPRESTGRR
jgi:LacI family transcriptional regulator